MVTYFDACEILEMLSEASIKVFLDGGWGVDALIGRETRIHNDIDLFVEKKDYGKAISVITYGYIGRKCRSVGHLAGVESDITAHSLFDRCKSGSVALKLSLYLDGAMSVGDVPYLSRCRAAFKCECDSVVGVVIEAELLRVEAEVTLVADDNVVEASESDDTRRFIA